MGLVAFREDRGAIRNAPAAIRTRTSGTKRSKKRTAEPTKPCCIAAPGGSPGSRRLATNPAVSRAAQNQVRGPRDVTADAILRGSSPVCPFTDRPIVLEKLDDRLCGPSVPQRFPMAIASELDRSGIASLPLYELVLVD